MKSLRHLVFVGAAAAVLGLTGRATAQIALTPIGSYGAGVFDESAAEIAAFDPGTAQLFVVNGAASVIDVLDISDPTLPTLVDSIGLPFGADFGGINSVAVRNGVIAVAIENTVVTDNGFVGLYDLSTFDLINTVTVGALPDAVTFTPDGSKLIVANEGEAASDVVNPEGTISIIDLSGGPAAAAATQLDFSAFTAQLDEANSPLTSVRINPVAQANTGVLSDLEPEFATVTADGSTAFVSLQENNAIAVVDLTSNTITDLIALGAKDHSLPGNGLDANDEDETASIETQPVFGLYMPDAIATYNVGGQDFIVTANEGDGRDDEDFGGFFEDFDDLDNLTVDPGFNGFSPGELDDFLDNDDGIGDLEISSIDGDLDGDGDLDQLFAFGARSFSIFDDSGTLVFDSGDDFESVIAQLIGDGELSPNAFNADNDSNDSLDSRSDDSGPEPEGIVLGQVGDQTLAFIGIERVGGVFVYDVTDPEDVRFLEYVNPRDFTIPDQDADDDDGDLDDNGFEDTDDGVLELNEAVTLAVGLQVDDLGALDLGPEGLVFISAADSPTGAALLVVTNEVSGTTTIYSIPEPGTATALLAFAALTALRRRRAHPVSD
ncbi:MAG: choice-of-anchor I family protein [Planctomycetota bacterium]